MWPPHDTQVYTARRGAACFIAVACMTMNHSHSIITLPEPHTNYGQPPLGIDASAGNRTRVTSMATMYSATRPPMPDTCLKNLCLQPARTHTPPLSICNLTQPQSSASAVGTCTGDRCLSFMHKTLGDWLMCVVNHTACAYTQHTQICERDRTHLYTDTMFRHRDSNPGRSGESRVS